MWHSKKLLVFLLLVGLAAPVTVVENTDFPENGNNNRYKITSRDYYRDDDILKIPIERPYTRVNRRHERRPLYPVRIVLGESPCIFAKYTYFFTEARKRDMLPYEVLMNATVTINKRDYYFYDAEDLCINVDDELNVDIWQFDCSPAGICICGLYFGYIDISIAPSIKNQQIQYLQVNGLDRKLVVEDEECRSGFKGHCSLLNSNVSLKHPLMCSSSYDCVLDNSYGPILQNAETKQVYGICLSKKRTYSGGRNLKENQVSINNACLKKA